MSPLRIIPTTEEIKTQVLSREVTSASNDAIIELRAMLGTAKKPRGVLEYYHGLYHVARYYDPIRLEIIRAFLMGRCDVDIAPCKDNKYCPHLPLD